MDKRNLAFGRTNFILLAIGFAVVVIGFILMGGSPSTEEAFQPDIFSFRRTRLAPAVCFAGFVSMIYAVIHRTKIPAEKMNEEAMADETIVKEA